VLTVPSWSDAFLSRGQDWGSCLLCLIDPQAPAPPAKAIDLVMVAFAEMTTFPVGLVVRTGTELMKDLRKRDTRLAMCSNSDAS
jgi:hypothetical protein